MVTFLTNGCNFAPTCWFSACFRNVMRPEKRARVDLQKSSNIVSHVKNKRWTWSRCACNGAPAAQTGRFSSTLCAPNDPVSRVREGNGACKWPRQKRGTNQSGAVAMATPAPKSNGRGSQLAGCRVAHSHYLCPRPFVLQAITAYSQPAETARLFSLEKWSNLKLLLFF